MGTFNSSKTFPYSVEDVAPVAQDVMDHFEGQDFEVTETNIPTGGAQVSIRKGGTFKAIIGMKTALNIKIEPVANGTTVDAGVGIFGQQAIPTAITLLVFWPVIIAQVWNMAHESNLDEEALDVAEESLKLTLRKHQARQPQSNRTKTGRRPNSRRHPDLLPLLLSGVGVSGVPKPPAPALLLASIQRIAWKKGKFSEVRCSKLNRSGRGLGTWTGAKRTPSRSLRLSWLRALPGIVASRCDLMPMDFRRIRPR